jgi:phosphatidylserine/phosphatidylglycerophosphate/cardiolipin synthase-like enzyme
VESVSAEIQLMKNRFYAKRILRLIRGAQKNIRLCLSRIQYEARSDDIIYRMLNELVYQAKRGIHVEVILESGPPEGERPVNRQARRFLFENGILVYNDAKDRKTRCNMLIVDDFTSVVGTTEWTRESFFENNEMEFWIESEAFADVMAERFEAIKMFGNRITAQGT